MGVKAVARRRQGYAHDVEIEGRHAILMDEPEGAGGTDLGPSPTRVLAAALAGCTAITVEMYADRKGWDLGGVEVEVEMEYGRASLPESFTVLLRVEAELSEEQRERLLVIAGKCPVHRALSSDTTVRVEDRIEPL